MLAAAAGGGRLGRCHSRRASTARRWQTLQPSSRVAPATNRHSEHAMLPDRPSRRGDALGLDDEYSRCRAPQAALRYKDFAEPQLA
jgi:hypothetical protein